MNKPKTGLFKQALFIELGEIFLVAVSVKKSSITVVFWICMALCFNAGVYFFLGKVKALEFFGGYVIEQSLSVDNLFLFLMIFSSFGIKPDYQKRILTFGIAGAVILRLIFILLGITIINRFYWVLYVFGAILIISAVKMIIKKEEGYDPSDKKLIRLIAKIIPVTQHDSGNRFFVREKTGLHVTPLFVVLIIIECTDIIFAMDSIPAVFSITTDPFIVYTSNIFAILGLRSLYFLLGRLQEKFAYVKYGVALILAFTGVKLLVLVYDIHIPLLWSLGIIFVLLAGSIIVSVIATRRIPIRTIRKKGAYKI